MTRRTGLRKDSAAHRVICGLVKFGGVALDERLMYLLPSEFRSPTRFKQSVTEPLADRGFILRDGDYLRATKSGKEYVAESDARLVPVKAPHAGQMALPRTAPPQRPLNLTMHYTKLASVTRREGSLDYLRYPSLMADQRINRYES